MFRLRPPLLKYQSTFDIVPVLAYVLSLHTASISLLFFKALFLIVYSSFSGVNSSGFSSEYLTFLSASGCG